MQFGGLQKLSLIDYPEKVAAIVFTQGCLFRCRYCHNPELIPTSTQNIVSQEEVLAYISFKKDFLDGVCITGGEPTLHADLPDFIKKVKALGLLVKLDTSGVNPGMVESLLRDGLVDYLAMDIKHRWESYNDIVQTANQQRIDNCKKTMRLIQESGIDHEFRTTVLPESHTAEDFISIAKQLLPGEKYFIQNISFAKNLDNTIDKSKQLDVSAIVDILKKSFPQVQIEQR
ncbi:MAG: anaerobic ribonucleoside-triphosphate reductase activating protein [Candidatus Buchananbacteria bacterium CG10_big_fil_rev_8_21_14_0_10_42_9]|uniref:Anaerobic ribonucleoside-triphosphate reductase activating protein n=1 Tax=Candidatus Buchananbacteria bacterium CG10_big_fil_rev_8_21_14_0_10_42_9 TaxID=1974526 RepID=A0A2H0W1C5_9BACT|nr:MAG: anaerobic ribonucleoside-triphosphate reductase activating protein [Candidatus Buchananbacteria bacterium CG10_big_fil_rev_8_21_14_0_10_42_9]